MLRDTFTRFLKDLNKLNPNELVIVTYDEDSHCLIFRQLNNIILAPYLSLFFLPKKGFEVGVLTQNGLNKLKYNLTSLLGNNLIDNYSVIPNIGVLSTTWWRNYPSDGLYVPQKYITLDYCNIKSKVLTYFLCRYYNNNSKLIYKIAKNEFKNKGKGNKSKQVTEST